MDPGDLILFERSLQHAVADSTLARRSTPRCSSSGGTMRSATTPQTAVATLFSLQGSAHTPRPRPWTMS